DLVREQAQQHERPGRPDQAFYLSQLLDVSGGDPHAAGESFHFMGFFKSHGGWFVGHPVAMLENANGDREVVVNCVGGRKRIELATNSIQGAVCARECAKIGLLYLEEGFVLPIEILLRSDAGLIRLQQAVDSAGCADTRVAETLNKLADGVLSQHTGGIGKSYDISVQFGHCVVEHTSLAP